MKNTHSLKKDVICVTLLGKPVMGISVLAAQACINGTKEIKHFSDHQVLLPFAVSLLVPIQNPTGVKSEKS